MMRVVARRLLIHSTLLTLVALAGACTETRRALGEDCLKNVDCLSGICSQLRCAAQPYLSDAQITAPAPSGAMDALSPADALLVEPFEESIEASVE
ncbi:MAG: hypothetical protein M3O50_00570 [Myxococcota bacterium]|nr:hypothetical protein [Myxococcota bacterium]